MIRLLTETLMGIYNKSNSSRALEGLHGVTVVPGSQQFALEKASRDGDFSSLSCGSSSALSVNQWVWEQRPSCDRNMAERVANVLTSLPFIALGIQAPRKNFPTRLYANSLIGCLTGALRNDNPRMLMAASAFLLPLRPFTVSALHTGMMEVMFAKRALKDPDLRMAHNVHKVSTLLGGVLFVADDALPQTPFIHAAWHLAAAVGVGTCNKLLE
ncbi:hypothetical protein SDJN02_21875 [Cucurbita argyrosperma subsp. argyrosperma]|nr:hypothetical protein SDJN02_21875 [Cucurbita argyrosperma subsp. argyrosperma]